MAPEHECVFQLGAHIYATVHYKNTSSPDAFLEILLNSLDFFLNCCKVRILVWHAAGSARS